MSDAAGLQGRTSASAISVASGLVVLGISAGVYLILSARAIGPAAFASLAVLWTAIYTIGIGLFIPFEQEIARAVSHRAGRGHGAGPVIVRAFAGATSLLLMLVLVVLVTLPWTWETLFDESPVAVCGLLLACGGLAVQYVQRGAFSGAAKFGAYGTQIAVEGFVRLVGTVVLALGGIASLAPYALLLGLAPILSVIMVSPAFLRLMRASGEPSQWRELSANLLWLLVAALAAQGLANVGTAAVWLLGGSLDADTAGHFMSGLTVARIPLFGFAAVQALLLPRLTLQLARGEPQTFRSQLGAVVATTAGLGLAGILATAFLGPEVLHLLFGEGFVLPRTDLVWLAVSTAVYMLALTFQPAVIALGRQRSNATAWTAGLCAFLVLLVAPIELLLRVEIALTIGGALTATILAWYAVTGASRASQRQVAHDPATSRLGLE